jgi:crotonobetainyl-CoA:carnitine CoA-transferase CaiB-like acyl-CoA transferase
MMGFLGADVVKIEPPGVGDPARHFSTVPLKPGEDSFYFIYFNQNKKGITLDMEKVKGREIFKEMVKWADVVVESYAPGTMERWGLSYDELREINPRLIMARISAYGPEGPYANYPSNDSVAQAMASVTTLTGWSDKPPVRGSVRVGETGSGINLFSGIMMALHQRVRTGVGQFVEVAMSDTVINLRRSPMTSRQMERDQMFRSEPAKRAGFGSTTRAPSSLYPTKDPGTFIIFLFHPQHQWDALLKVIGREDLIGDPRFADEFIRGKNREVVDQVISEWTKTKTGYEAFTTLASAGVSTGVTYTSTQAMNDATFIDGGKVVEMEHPVRGKYKALSYAPTLEKSLVEVTNAPLLGQDNEKVYADILGYTKEDLARLEEAGVI